LDHSQLAAMYSRGEVKPSLSTRHVMANRGGDYASPHLTRMSFSSLGQSRGRALLVHEIHLSFGSDMITLHSGQWWARKVVQSMDAQPMAVCSREG